MLDSMFDDVKRMDKRQFYYQVRLFVDQNFKFKFTSLSSFIQVLSFGMIVSSALMIWKGLMVVTGSESPIVVVLSGSMEPAFHRGDLLFLTNYQGEDIRVGEIVVFKVRTFWVLIPRLEVNNLFGLQVEGRDIPIVHRVLKLHEQEDGTVKFLTKGDNNSVDDRGLYAPGQNWLSKKDVVGRARGFLPYVGIVTIIMNEYPKFKYAVLAALGLYVLVHREWSLNTYIHTNIFHSVLIVRLFFAIHSSFFLELVALLLIIEKEKQKNKTNGAMLETFF